MSTETTWTVDSEPDEQPTLWDHRAHPNGRAVAGLDDGRLFVYDRHNAAPMWHAATAVLAPSDAQIEAAARGLYEAEAGCGDAPDWDELHEPTQELYTSQARAMLAALRVAAEEAGS